MIFTVFFTDNEGYESTRMPQDFPTYQGALEYAEEESGEYTILSNNGECI